MEKIEPLGGSYGNQVFEGCAYYSYRKYIKVDCLACCCNLYCKYGKGVKTEMLKKLREQSNDL